MKAKNFIYGLLIGGVVGSISTLLSAPVPGKETRETLKNNKDTWVNHLKELKESLMDLKDSSVHVSKEGKEAISQFITDLNVSISKWKLEIQPHQQELQQELVEIEESIHQLETELAKDTPNAEKEA